MLIILIRTLVIYLTLVIVMRLMGKRQIGEMQPFEFIVTLIIADLSCVPMSDVSIPLLYGIVSILALFFIHQVLSIFEQKSNKFKNVISGKPSVVIDQNGVNLLELNKNNMDIDDLLESLRILGYFSFDDVSYAIYESNGKLSALENQNQKQNAISRLIISGGKIILRCLPNLSLTKNDIENFLSENNVKLKNTEVMTLDNNGRVYLKEKRKKYQILSFNLGDFSL